MIGEIYRGLPCLLNDRRKSSGGTIRKGPGGHRKVLQMAEALTTNASPGGWRGIISLSMESICVPLRANIPETPVVPLIYEQGEKEIGRDER